MNLGSKIHLELLENKKRKLLMEQKEVWRLKSREIWLQSGDENTKFFQSYAKGRKYPNMNE